MQCITNLNSELWKYKTDTLHSSECLLKTDTLNYENENENATRLPHLWDNWRGHQSCCLGNTRSIWTVHPRSGLGISPTVQSSTPGVAATPPPPHAAVRRSANASEESYTSFPSSMRPVPTTSPALQERSSNKAESGCSSWLIRCTPERKMCESCSEVGTIEGCAGEPSAREQTEGSEAERVFWILLIGLWTSKFGLPFLQISFPDIEFGQIQSCRTDISLQLLFESQPLMQPLTWSKIG